MVVTQVLLLLAAGNTPPPPPPPKEPFCVPAHRGENLLPSWFSGRFKIVGAGANGTGAYAGDLQISQSGSSLKLLRRIGLKATTGTAKYVACGTETKMPLLHVTYGSKPHTQEFFCKINSAWGPQHRVTCTSQVPASDNGPIEAWFEVYEMRSNNSFKPKPLRGSA
jgi:hypothetical protein